MSTKPSTFPFVRTFFAWAIALLLFFPLLWLGLTAFFSMAFLLSLLIFVGEAVRDALDPRKTFRSMQTTPLVETVKETMVVPGS